MAPWVRCARDAHDVRPVRSWVRSWKRRLCVADDNTNEKLDRIIELLGAIVESLERTESADSNTLVWSELGSINSTLQAIEHMIRQQVQ